MIVYLPIDIQTRELKANELFACKLVNAGYQVILGREYDVCQIALERGDGIYIGKSEQSNLYVELQKRGVKVFLKNEEGVVLPEYNVYKERLNLEVLKTAEKKLVWGEKEAEYISRFYPNVKEKICYTGNVRIDLLRPNNAPIYEEVVRSIKNKYGRFILVNSNFKLGINQKNKEIHVGHLRGLNMSEEAIRTLYSREEDIERIIIDGIKNISQYVNIVFRPHPSEDVEYYENLFCDCHNVNVVREGEVNSWIIASEAVLHNSCTTGMEAYIAKKPVIAYLPNGKEITEGAISNILSYIVSNENELTDVVKSIIANECKIDFYNADKDIQLNQYVYFNKEKESADIILSEIKKIYDKENDANKADKIYQSVKEVAKAFYYENKNRFWAKVRHSSDSMWNYNISCSDIRKSISNMCYHMKYDEIKVRPYRRNVWLIGRE